MYLRDYSVKRGGKLILNEINASFPSGRICHLLGRNGSGKSTFAKALAGLIPSEGFVGDAPRSIAVVGSYTNLPAGFTVSEIVSLSSNRASKDLFNLLFSALDLGSIDERRRYAQLSDGQKQKIKLLFFISKGPSLLVLDEFTNALDGRTSREVQECLLRYCDSAQVVVINITHDVTDLKRMPGAYYVLEDGLIDGGMSEAEAVGRYMGVGNAFAGA